MPEGPHEFRRTLTTRDGRTAEVVVTSDQELSGLLEDECFDLLFLATTDPERTELTVTIRVSRGVVCKGVVR